MEPFTEITAIAAPLLRANVDTDAIIPSREMKRPSKIGLSEGLFAGWRYVDEAARRENPEFILNQRPFRDAEILLAGANFGCGSSREHAVWALREWGVRAIVAPSFGAIFYSNCVRNGVLPITLKEELIRQWDETIIGNAPAATRVSISLTECFIVGPDAERIGFGISDQDREMLLEGLDGISVTLKHHGAAIEAFEREDRIERAWAYL